ncbi:threonine/serine dehydratase [Ulvibacterium sp.]|uniref:threonine ammonia-lyase n=1 Tax=Ulvibacterium sp. TaxID=2665914 RepID=UPI0026317364|nr:pyridoxal-phosphate dependent enzyme [Ulvibacterium sp.]
MITLKHIQDAYKNIQSDIRRTPLVYSQELSEISKANVYLKLENFQKTGSFKIRGVLNKLYGLNEEDFKKTFVAASTGNHAAAFAYASKHFGFEGVLVLPERITKAKVKAIENYDVKKIFYGKNSLEAEEKATEISRQQNAVLVHPYNDAEIIAGQGTLGMEIKEQFPDVAYILAPVGGGGLISGLCSYFKESSSVKVVGCQPVNAAEMYESIQNGSIVSPSTKDTISDATAGGIEKDAITFDICKEYKLYFELLTEEAIKKALGFIIKHHEMVIEPGASLPVAALMNSSKYRGKNVVLVLTGKKINKELLNNIMKDDGFDN